MFDREPRPPKEIGCHLTGFKQKCRKLVDGGECDMWQGFAAFDKDGPFTAFGCLDKWKAKFARDALEGLDSVYKITESMRNEFMALAGHPNGHPDAVALGQFANGHQLTDQTEK